MRKGEREDMESGGVVWTWVVVKKCWVEGMIGLKKERKKESQSVQARPASHQIHTEKTRKSHQTTKK